MRTLYLGLRPKPGVVHYPVIRTECCATWGGVKDLWPQFTHVIFTSQTAVEYWPGPWDKLMIAIGDATGARLEERGIQPIVAPCATQEGIIELVRHIGDPRYFLIPRSRLARPVLIDFLTCSNIRFHVLDLYDTLFQRPEPIPDLNEFDEIIFTSPSTVEGFLRIYGTLPPDKKLTAIGPITAAALIKRSKKISPVVYNEVI